MEDDLLKEIEEMEQDNGVYLEDLLSEDDLDLLTIREDDLEETLNKGA